MDDINKIKDRIAKLLAMAADTSSPEEAAIAMQRARRLMDKHQIDEASINPLEQQPFAEERVTKGYKYMPMWLDRLAVSVAKYNDCQATKVWDLRKARYVNVQFRGLEQDVAIAKQMFDRLCSDVDRRCKAYMRQNGHESYYMASIGNAYKVGMQQRLSAKLAELTEERDQITMDGQPGTSLVVKKAEIVNRKYGDPGYVNKTSRIKDDKDTAKAFVKGYMDGDAVHINVQVSE